MGIKEQFKKIYLDHQYKFINEENNPRSFFRIELISAIILIGFVCAIIFHYILGVYLGLGYPYNTFLFIPSDRFMDFFNPFINLKNLNPYFEPGALTVAFPLTYLIWFGFSLIGARLSFLICLISFTIFFVLYNYQYLFFNAKNGSPSQKFNSFKNLFIFSFLTYPFLFVIDRGNFLFVAFIFLILFFFFFKRENFIASSFFLGICIALKPFFAIFLLLFLKNKHYKEIIYTLLISSGLTIISLLSFKGGIFSNISGFFNQMSYYQTNYVIGNSGLAYNSSFWGALKLLNSLVLKLFSVRLSIYDLSNVYLLICVIFVILLSLYLIFIEKEQWKIVTLLIFSYILLPQVSGDYSLLFIFIPMYMFIFESKTTATTDIFYCVGFALLLIPKDYFIIFGNVSISILLNPLIMILISGVIIHEGIKSSNYNLKLGF